MGLPTSPRLASELQEPAAPRRAVAPAPPATFLDGGPLLPARVTTVSWLALPASCGALLHLRMAAEAPAAVVPALIGPLAGCSCCSAAGLLRQVNRWKLAIGGTSCLRPPREASSTRRSPAPESLPGPKLPLCQGCACRQRQATSGRLELVPSPGPGADVAEGVAEARRFDDARISCWLCSEQC